MTCIIPAADSFGLKGERARLKRRLCLTSVASGESVGRVCLQWRKEGKERVRPKLSMIAYSVSTAAAAAGVACNGERELGGRPSLHSSSSCSLACSLPVHYRNDQAALRGSLAENSLAACTPRSKESQDFPENARKNRAKNRIRC